MAVYIIYRDDTGINVLNTKIVSPRPSDALYIIDVFFKGGIEIITIDANSGVMKLQSVVGSNRRTLDSVYKQKIYRLKNAKIVDIFSKIHSLIIDMYNNNIIPTESQLEEMVFILDAFLPYLKRLENEYEISNEDPNRIELFTNPNKH